MRKMFLLSLLCLGLFISCTAQPSGYMVKPAKFNTKTAANLASGDVVMLDVRTPAEFKKSHINGAINMDVNAADFETQIATIEVRKDIFLYCQAGSRSSKASAIMRKAGFEQVYELEGGLLAWRKEGLALTLEGDTAPATVMTREEFTVLATTGPKVLIDFYAEWCGPCKAMEPMLAELSETYKGQFTIVRINVDENPNLAIQLGAEKLPYFLYFENQKEGWTHQGALTREEILKKANL